MSTMDTEALPHGPAMKLIVGIKALEESVITCACRIPTGFPWADGRPMPVYLAIEGVAQAAGLLAAAGVSGRPDEREGPPRHGYVTRIRHARFPASHFDPDADWSATVRMVGQSGNMALCQGEALQAGQELLQVRLALYL